jgi:hypothetical protein
MKGCPPGQPFLFGKPYKISELERSLKDLTLKPEQ